MEMSDDDMEDAPESKDSDDSGMQIDYYLILLKRFRRMHTDGDLSVLCGTTMLIRLQKLTFIVEGK